MDKILITGGTSFVGHHLRATALRHDLTTYCIGRKEYDEGGWQDGRWSAIIHLAPCSPTQVLDYAKKHNVRVLYASSGIVYHSENYEREEYRHDKIKYEGECLYSGADVVVARLFTFCGERLDKFKAISAFYEAARANKPLIITGDGSTVRSYLHGRIMAHWMWTILERGVSGEAYDVGSEFPVTMLQLANWIISQTGSSSEIVIEGGTDPMPLYLPENMAKTKALTAQLVHLHNNGT